MGPCPPWPGAALPSRGIETHLRRAASRWPSSTRRRTEKSRQYADIREVVRYMRGRDKVPTWIVGGSASTMAAVNFAADHPQDEPLGVIIFAPGQPDVARAALVRGPTQVVYHREDPVSAAFVDPLFDALTAAPAKERLGLAGGSNGGECGGHHLFMGIDAEFVAAVAGFIDKYNPTRR